MDLSPRLLTDVQFREQWRGYNPDEVDEFLERVAAGVEELQQRLNEVTERASSAERRLLEHTDEDEIRRTLVLAQRTAVASMEEARAEADRLVSETEARCRHLVAEAEAHAARLEADIAAKRRLELGDLAEQRAALQHDVDDLQGFLDTERARLAELLRGQLESLEGGYALRDAPTVSDVAPPPPLAPVELRAAETIDAPSVDDEPVAAAPIAAEPEEDSFASILEPDPEPAPDTSAVDELRLAREELADALRRAGVEPAGGDDDDEPQRPLVALYDDEVGEPTGAFDVLADEQPAASEPDDGPRWRDEPEDDDPFLAELRRAVGDTEPLGPRDHEHDAASTPYQERDDEDADPGGFFRRGRRRG